MSESPPRSSTSEEHNASGILIDDENLTLNINDEAVEIARLELPYTKPSCEESKSTANNDELSATIQFNCSACKLHEMVHYYGKCPPFLYAIKFLEDTFVMRDPFQPPPMRSKPKSEYFLALGANCYECQQTVCKGSACSFYYVNTYCIHCAKKCLLSFPLEIQSKIRKQLQDK